jgi:acyl-coenzyme A synthetase/AMP-(fatty) acid ligase
VVESGWLRSAGTDWLPPGVEHVVEFGHRDGTLADILDGSDVFEPVRPDPDTIVGLSYTSGSTGKPKGVVDPAVHRSDGSQHRRRDGEHDR